MPTVVYLVHGIGAGTADGSARPAADRWDASVVDAMRWVCDTFGLPKPTVVDPTGSTLPANANDPEAIWLAPVSYYAPFDDFRRDANNRANLSAKLGIAGVADAEIQKIADKDLLWVNCLDVLLWWADKVQARNQATTNILTAITNLDILIKDQAPDEETRRILVSHSLGTAATTFALADHLGKEQVWLDRGAFEAWFTLANVAPFVLSLGTTYNQPLIPDFAPTLVTGSMYHARHEFDPIPRLMPWRMYDPVPANDPSPLPAWSAGWKRAKQHDRLTLLETAGVVAQPTAKPTIMDVHGFGNYLMAPPVATKLAVHMRGEPFTRAELDAIDCEGAWKALPALQCQRDAAALAALGADVRAWVDSAPAGGDGPGTWVPRLIRGVEMLLAAKERC